MRPIYEGNEASCKWCRVTLVALTDGKRGPIRDCAPKPTKLLHRSVTQTNTPQWQKLPWRHTWIPFHAKRKRCSAPAHHYTKNGGQTTARPPAASRAHFLGVRHFYIGANLGSVRLARTEPFRLFFLDSWKATIELPPKGGSWTTYIVPTWSGRDIESCPSSFLVADLNLSPVRMSRDSCSFQAPSSVLSVYVPCRPHRPMTVVGLTLSFRSVYVSISVI